MADPALDLLWKYRDFCNSSYRGELEGATKSLDAFVGPFKLLDFSKLTDQIIGVLAGVQQLTLEEQTLLRHPPTLGQAAYLAMSESHDIAWPERETRVSQARSILKMLWEQSQVVLKDLATKKEEREKILKEKEATFAELEARTKLGQVMPAIEAFVERAK